MFLSIIYFVFTIELKRKYDYNPLYRILDFEHFGGRRVYKCEFDHYILTILKLYFSIVYKKHHTFSKEMCEASQLNVAMETHYNKKLFFSFFFFLIEPLQNLYSFVNFGFSSLDINLHSKNVFLFLKMVLVLKYLLKIKIQKSQYNYQD